MNVTRLYKVKLDTDNTRRLVPKKVIRKVAPGTPYYPTLYTPSINPIEALKNTQRYNQNLIKNEIASKIRENTEEYNKNVAMGLPAKKLFFLNQSQEVGDETLEKMLGRLGQDGDEKLRLLINEKYGGPSIDDSATVRTTDMSEITKSFGKPSGELIHLPTLNEEPGAKADTTDTAIGNELDANKDPEDKEIENELDDDVDMYLTDPVSKLTKKDLGGKNTLYLFFAPISYFDEVPARQGVVGTQQISNVETDGKVYIDKNIFVPNTVNDGQLPTNKEIVELSNYWMQRYLKTNKSKSPASNLNRNEKIKFLETMIANHSGTDLKDEFSAAATNTEVGTPSKDVLREELKLLEGRKMILTPQKEYHAKDIEQIDEDIKKIKQDLGITVEESQLDSDNLTRNLKSSIDATLKNLHMMQTNPPKDMSPEDISRTINELETTYAFLNNTYSSRIGKAEESGPAAQETKPDEGLGIAVPEYKGNGRRRRMSNIQNHHGMHVCS